MRGHVALLALIVAATAVSVPAHGDEPDAFEETIRALRRDTNFTLSYPPGGPPDLRIYRDGNAAAAGPADTEPREDEATLREQALGSTDAAERSAALQALLGTEVGLQTALDVLTRDTEPEVLKNALDVLTGYVTLPLEPVLGVVRNEDPAVRIQALELLAIHRERDPRVDQVLNRAAATDRDADVRESARGLLGLSD